MAFSRQHLSELMTAHSPDAGRFSLVISSKNQSLVDFSVFALSDETTNRIG
jgi:hypothetical protein